MGACQTCQPNEGELDLTEVKGRPSRLGLASRVEKVEEQISRVADLVDKLQLSNAKQDLEFPEEQKEAYDEAQGGKKETSGYASTEYENKLSQAHTVIQAEEDEDSDEEKDCVNMDVLEFLTHEMQNRARESSIRKINHWNEHKISIKYMLEKRTS